MRVWQPGSHLTQQRGAEVDDWSWARTRRRILTLARLTRPYRARTLLSVVSLLAATATALAPPFLSKYAVDDGIRRHDLGRLWWIVGAFLAAGLAGIIVHQNNSAVIRKLACCAAWASSLVTAES